MLLAAKADVEPMKVDMVVCMVPFCTMMHTELHHDLADGSRYKP